MPTNNATQEQDSVEEEIDGYEDARGALKQIFDLLGVEQVIVVDDDLDSEPELGDFTNRCRNFFTDNPQRLRCVPNLTVREGDDFDDDIRPQLEAMWEPADDDFRDQLMVCLGWIAPKKTVSSLRSLCQDYAIKFLSLQEWKAGFDANTSEGILGKTIFLFDLDMSKEKDGRNDEGMRLIAELLKTGKKCQCALFSHLVKKDAEYESWQNYVTDFDLDGYQNDFVVISKKHLPDAPITFAQRLKRAAIAPLCDDLTDEIVNVFDAALNEAKDEIDDLNIYDFEEIVFQSSHSEGVWEPDTVLRILALYTQRAARKLLKENKGIEDAAAHVRKVIDLPYRPSDAPAPSSRKILRLERYEDKGFLRDHHIPLDLGDIFQNDDGHEFVLLAQQCNIMCRNSEDFIRPQKVTIAPLVAKGGVEVSPRLWEMEAYATDQNQHIYVNFLDAISVPILALDLTVFSKDGKSVFHTDEKCPTSVVPSWRKRHEQVLGEVNDIVKRYKKALSQVTALAETEPAALVDPAANGADQEALENDADADKLLCQALTNSVPDVLLGAIDADNPRVSYNIERVARLKPPYASALLRAYAAYLARDGFDHDLTRTNQSSRVS